MFTGIVSRIGKVKSVRTNGAGKVLVISMTKDIINPEKGMSIAINGTCLTATLIKNRREFDADVTKESYDRTNLSKLRIGSKVNVEFPMTAQQFLSGHIVQGHVDTMGKVEIIKISKEGAQLTVSYPAKYDKYMIEKGSVSVDGVSLTAFDLKKNKFVVAVIPETIASTIIKDYKKGTDVNLEFDVIGKYVEKFMRKK